MSSNIRKLLGLNIRTFRRARSFTQEALAEMVDVSGSYVGYLERGEKSPSLDVLVKIAEVLNVNPAALLTSPDDSLNRELKKLISVLSDKGPGPIKFMNEIAAAYFKSLESG